VIVAGVDPGKLGAIAVLDADGGVLELAAIPVIKSSTGRAHYDLASIRDMLLALHDRHVFVTVERLQPMPAAKGGTIANYNRGESQGWNWMLEALKIPYHLVSPQTWQRVMHAGTPGTDPKQRSILAAQRLFPGVSLRRTPKCRVPSDGYAEALLLAEYGRRGRFWPTDVTGRPYVP
jgi:crossover junction endodeoxyribonuclease RuvC